MIGLSKAVVSGVVGWMCALSGVATFLGVVVAAQVVAAQSPGSMPSGDAKLVLTESDYARSYYQFGWDRFSSKALKDPAEVDKKIVDRLERPVKNFMAERNIDWGKNDWRDFAWTNRDYTNDDAPEFRRPNRFTEPPAANWAQPDFDDSAWPRQVRPMGVGPLHGVLFTERGNLCAGLQVACHRYAFELPDPPRGELTLQAQYVGGVRIFLNGKEIARGHLPQGELDADAASEPYPAEAYRWKFSELSQKDQEGIHARYLKGKPDPEYWGYAGWNIQPGSRLWKLRNRELPAVKLPAELLRKGQNVLAVEVRTAPIHPLILADDAWTAWRGGGSGIPMAWLHGALTVMQLRSSKDMAARTGGVQVWAESMYHRVTSRDYRNIGEGAGLVRLVGPRNGSYSAQVLIRGDQEIKGVKITPGELFSKEGPSTLPATCVQVQGMAPLPALRIHELGYGRIPVGESFYSGIGACFGHAFYWGRYATKPDDKLETIADVRIFDHITAAVPDRVQANTCQPYWVTVQVPSGTAPGLYKGQIAVEAGPATARSAVTSGKAHAVPVELEVVAWTLPEPRDFQTIIAIEQSPYAVAKQYSSKFEDRSSKKEAGPTSNPAAAKTPGTGTNFAKDAKLIPVPKDFLWTDEHFRLIEASLKQLGRVGNDWWFVPVIQGTEFGNREQSMIRWTRSPDGKYSFDYKLLDRYLELIVKHCGKPRVVDFVVMHGAPGRVQVSVLDLAGGKEETLDLSEANLDRAIPWRQFANALYGHMQSLGLGEAMHWGYGWDTEGDPKLKDLLKACVPNVYWTYGAHSRGGGSGGRMEADSLSMYRSVVEIYSLAKQTVSKKGWKRYPDMYLHNPRNGSVCNVTEGFSQPYNYRLLVDRSLGAGFNGIGRIGGDYWAGSYYDGCGVSAYNMAGFGIMKVLWPGPNGAEPSARFEGIREGVQEAEARIVIEQALDRGLLDEALAKKMQAMLEQYSRETFWIPPHVSADFFNEGAQGWLDRSRRLYQAAAEVASAVGLDVERTELPVALAPQEQRTLPVVLRGWSDKPRAYKAAATQPWIVLDKPEGQVAGRGLLNVRLDAGKLAPEQKAEGSITITDAASGKSSVVKIAASVGKVFEFSNNSIVLNIPAGGQEVREGLSIYNSSAGPISWKAAASLPWVRAIPAEGAIPPGAIALLKLSAEPTDKQAARHQGSLSIQVGALTKEVPLTAYVIPAYQPPALPQGTAVWLMELVGSKKLKQTSSLVAGKNGAANFAGTVPGGLEEKYTTDRCTLPFALGKQTFLRGMWVAPNHESAFDLEGSSVTGFSSWVALTPGVESGRGNFINKDAILCFEIYVDGKLAAQSGPIKAGVGPRLLAVTGLDKAKTLRLATRRIDGIDDPRSTGVWADSTFYMSDAPARQSDVVAGPADLADRYRQERQMWQDGPIDAVKSWAFLGPFAQKEGAQEPEGKLDFSAAYEGIGGKVSWRAAAVDAENALRLEKQVKDCAGTTCFAAVVLESPKPQIIQVGIGQGGRWNCSITGYLNGKRAYYYQGGVGVKDNALRTLMQLEKGPNTLLFRLDEASAAGGLILTYRGEGLTVRLPDGVK